MLTQLQICGIGSNGNGSMTCLKSGMRHGPTSGPLCCQKSCWNGKVPVSRFQQIKVSARGNSEADLYDPRIGIDVSYSYGNSVVDQIDALPLYVKVPGGFITILACSRLIGYVMRRKRRNALEERGFKRDTAADEDHYDRMMKGMKTVKYDELSDEQMAAARRRRQREVANDSMDIDTLELPANHPFAVHQEMTPEEEELQRQRLLARRGLSAQDLELLKKAQQMADETDRA